MSQDLKPGDFLIFQLEAGFGLLRFLGNSEEKGEKAWHLAAYSDLFLDSDSADLALETPEKLSVSHPHLVLTTRAFESTQVARMTNVPLNSDETRELEDTNIEVSDRSVRLLLGLR